MIIMPSPTPTTQDTKFSTLVELFRMLELQEKGIETVYDYLLKNTTIDNIKEISSTLQISLKRLYKILAVLKDLGLVQVYDRPMKVMLQPPIPAWERLISQKMEELRIELEEKNRKCQIAFEEMQNAYNLQEVRDEIPPVEFIPFTAEYSFVDYIQLLYNDVKEFLQAKGFYHQNAINEEYTRKIIKSLTKPLSIKEIIKTQPFRPLFMWLKELENKTIKILISEDYFVEMIEKIKEFPNYNNIKDTLEKGERIFNPEVEIRISNRPMSSFIVQDHKKLLQFSVDPSNYLQGIYVSYHHEIIEIFREKFLTLFEEGKSYDVVFKKHMNRNPVFLDYVLTLLL